MDDFMPKLPRRWVKVGTWAGSLADDGVRLDRAGDRARFHVEVAREAARGDRMIGLARGQAESVHRFPAYALELDSTTSSAEELAAAMDAVVPPGRP